jgi:hypothetical protein
MGWESDRSTIGSMIVEVWEEPTRHVVHVKKLSSWLNSLRPSASSILMSRAEFRCGLPE